MYVAVKGGEAAIDAAHALLDKERRGDTSVPELSIDQVREQLAIGVARVMSEGSLYDPDLAALAVKQARGDLIEAIFLLRAFRTTLPRFGYSVPIDTNDMKIRRRISATFKDLPGGQVLGPTFDYTHRLLDPNLADATHETKAPAAATKTATRVPDKTDENASAVATPSPRVTKLLDSQGLIETNTPSDPDRDVGDLTRDPLEFPADRDTRLQALARGDEGFLLALGYSTQRGFGRTHPFVGEIRMGDVEVFFEPEELGFEVPLGPVTMTECEMVNQFIGSSDAPPQFTRGYGLVFGHSERKAMSMALVDRALRAGELGEERKAPAQDEEFVLSHADNVQATGFVEHLKLPHYVDFQAELGLVRQMRDEWHTAHEANDDAEAPPSSSEAAE
ncbi:MAG: carbon-phosphorus lyase complex subunit PhnI [Pseudomonadota bacterium]